MRQVVVITGRICTGKSGLAKGLRDEFGYELVQTSEILKQQALKRGRSIDRISLQQLGDEMDKESNYLWLFEEVQKQAAALAPYLPIVVDNVRNAEQLEHFRTNHGLETVHVHLYAPNDVLYQRYEKHNADRPGEEAINYSMADIIKDDDDVNHFKRDADVRINTGRTDAKDTLVRVAARLRLYSPPNVRCVDVIVGGQYGSEGKGHVAAYLAKDYDVLVRVGGPNAGHTVSSASGVYTYHQLPSGARDTSAQLLLGPGMTINVESLLDEIEDCNISTDRLFIDPQVMIIEKEDIEREKELVSKIASTGRGGGAAAARRILGRKPGATRLARDIPSLQPYVGHAPPYRGATTHCLEVAYREGLSILLEGTQGSGLSLYHGQYPYVTSRETNVAGCLAEAGISPSRVRRILMVIRSTPIRVGDPDSSEKFFNKLLTTACGAITGIRDSGRHGREHSGPLKHEVTFTEVAENAQLDAAEVLKVEKTSTTKRDRRVGWFDWEQFRHACSLNAPTDIVLTFADYIDGKNREARRFEQLTTDTIKFIEELERVAQAPVSLINTRFPRDVAEKMDLRTVIDRRNWTSQKQRPRN